MEWEEVRKNKVKSDFISVIKNLSGDDAEVITKYVKGKGIVHNSTWDLAAIKNEIRLCI